MDHANERRLCARVTGLGESADAAAFGELADFTRAESARVRRLAASAIGKLAGIVPAGKAVAALLPLLRDEHPQCRQYAAKALGAFGAAAEKALPDLRDLYRNPAEKDYVKRSVLAAGKTIREAIRLAAAQVVRVCQRCGARVDADEYARSWRAFDRTFCDKCFDEVYLERSNFDKQKLYQQEGKRVISLYPADKPRLAEVLREKLGRYAMLPPSASASESAPPRWAIPDV
jgi:hypothetical protein